MNLLVNLLTLALLAASSWAADLAALPRDAAKEAWVRAALDRVGLANEIRVVRDDALTGTSTCAYAILRDRTQYVAYDPECVTTLTPGEENYAWSAGVVLHEIAHHLAAHTAASGAKTPIEREIEAERWVGWAFRHSGSTLGQALSYARRGPETASSTHPGKADRVKAVERGWRQADTLLTSTRTPGTAVPAASSQTETSARPAAEHLADAARRQLKALRK